MQSSVLYRRSKFFVDAMNVVLYTDLFIYHELKYRMEHQDELLSILFGEKFPKVTAKNPEEEDIIVINLTAKKLHQNILLDWINSEKYDTDSLNMSLAEYLANLYYDILTNPICDDYIQMTEFGNTLKLLTVDNNLNSLSVWLPFYSEFLIDSIHELFSGLGAQKIEIVIGDKSSILTHNVFYDSYCFENVTDVDRFIAVAHPSLSEVIIPTYEYNLVESRTDVDKLLEQVTFHKLNLRRNQAEYTERFNLSVNTITTPI